MDKEEDTPEQEVKLEGLDDAQRRMHDDVVMESSMMVEQQMCWIFHLRGNEHPLKYPQQREYMDRCMEESCWTEEISKRGGDIEVTTLVSRKTQKFKWLGFTSTFSLEEREWFSDSEDGGPKWEKEYKREKWSTIHVATILLVSLSLMCTQLSSLSHRE